jgi:hypothetical protein
LKLKIKTEKTSKREHLNLPRAVVLTLQNFPWIAGNGRKKNKKKPALKFNPSKKTSIF